METVNNENAQESLAVIENTMTKTRKAVAAGYSSPLMILWGLLLMAAYTAAYFYIKYAAIIFWTMAAVGTAGGFLVWFLLLRKIPFKESSGEKMNLRIGGLWWLLFLYIFIWLGLLSPFNGMQMNAFIITAIMFGYIILGLWFTAYYMIWTGLFVTAMTLTGFYLLPHYYCLWMAFMCGGVIFCIGLYIKLRWI
ncbi:MAG: hypothetical protein WC496_04950 [Phycisphaerae bacterium]|jgi:MFS family permease